MSGVFVYLFCVFTTSVVHCQEVTTAPTIPEKQTVSPTNTLNSTGVTNDALSDENPAWEPPEVLPDSVSGVGVPGHPKTKHNLKPLAVHFTQKFSDWSRPIYEKFCKIKGLLSHNDHPNYGGVLGPQQIWEKWQEKGHHFLTGIHGAVYGLASLENHDYPFAYRGLTGSSEKSAKS